MSDIIETVIAIIKNSDLILRRKGLTQEQIDRRTKIEIRTTPNARQIVDQIIKSDEDLAKIHSLVAPADSNCGDTFWDLPDNVAILLDTNFAIININFLSNWSDLKNAAPSLRRGPDLRSAKSYKEILPGNISIEIRLDLIIIDFLCDQTSTLKNIAKIEWADHHLIEIIKQLFSDEFIHSVNNLCEDFETIINCTRQYIERARS